MTTYNININIREKGAAPAAAGVAKVGKAADESRSLVDGLKFALLGLVSVAALRQLQHYTDTFIELQNRLRIVSKGTQDLRDTTKRLGDIAAQTRTSFALTGELYARVSIATEKLGNSSTKTARFVELVNKVIQSSGVNAREAEAGLIQFSQGLASNRLAGDELKSVLEGIPELGRAIARGLGVGFGDLRRLGAEQKLTAEAVFNALISQGDRIDRTFNMVRVSISKAFENIQTAITLYVGALDESFNVSGKVVFILEVLARNIDIVAAATLGLATAVAILGAAWLAAAIPAAVVAIVGMVTPLGAAAAAAGGLTIAVGLLGDKLNSIKIEEGGVSLLDSLRAWREILTDLVGIIVDRVISAFRALEGVFRILAGVVRGVIAAIELIGGVLVLAAVSVVKFSDSVKEGVRSFVELKSQEVKDELGEIGKGFLDVRDAVIATANGVTGFIEGLITAFPRAARLAAVFRDLRGRPGEAGLLTPGVDAPTGTGNEKTRQETLASIGEEILARTKLATVGEREKRIEGELTKIKTSFEREKFRELNDLELESIRDLLEGLEEQKLALKGVQELARVDPEFGALLEYESAVRNLSAALEADMILEEDLEMAVGRLTRKFNEAKNPIHDVTQALRERIRVLSVPEDDQALERSLIAAEKAAQERGQEGGLTRAQREEVERLVRQEEWLKQIIKDQTDARREQLRVQREAEREAERQRKAALKAAEDARKEAERQFNLMLRTAEAANKLRSAQAQRGRDLLARENPIGEARDKLAEDLFNLRVYAEEVGLSEQERLSAEENIRAARQKSIEPLKTGLAVLDEQIRIQSLNREGRESETLFLQEKNRLIKEGVDFSGEVGARALEEVKQRTDQIANLRRANKAVKELGEEIRHALVQGFNKASEAMARFFVTGGREALNFGKILENLAVQLVNIALQRAIFQPLLGGLFGGAGAGTASAVTGAALPGSAGVNLNAKGGILDGPTVFATRSGLEAGGEAGPEALLPLMRDNRGRLGVVATGGGGGGNTFNSTVNVNLDAEASQDPALAEEAGAAAGRAAEQQIRAMFHEMLSDEQRVGGQLNPKMVV